MATRYDGRWREVSGGPRTATPYSDSKAKASRSLADSEEAKELISRFKRICGNRGTWESHWEEIAQRVLPAHASSFSALNIRQPGEKRTEYIFDSTASIALKRFGAILDSLLTPRNQKWHRIVPDNPSLIEDREVALWFEQVNDLLFKYRYSPKANFASQNYQNWLSIGAFGSGSMWVDALDGEPGLRYRQIHLGEVYFEENHQGVVDTVYRHFRMTARQAWQKWGDKIPESIKTAMASKPDAEFWFLHCVHPNPSPQPGAKTWHGMPFLSRYVSIEGNSVVDRGGFNSFPYAVSRYEQAPGEIYGRSPAMDVLPSIKTLNEQQRTVLVQGQRTVDPILLVHDDGVLDTFSLTPGAINTGGVDANGRLMVQTLPIGNVAVGKELMDDQRQVINDAFLVTIFQILVETPEMTATEVLERTREKGILLAPTIGRQQSEYLGPLIEREIDLLAQQGLLPPMPPKLIEAGGEYKIEYDSPLSRAQRAEEGAGLIRTLEVAMNIAGQTQDTSVMDNFDLDVAIRDLAKIHAVPEKWMRAVEDAAAIREQRAQAAQQQAEVEAAPGAAALANAGVKAAEAEVELE